MTHANAKRLPHVERAAHAVAQSTLIRDETSVRHAAKHIKWLLTFFLRRAFERTAD